MKPHSSANTKLLTTTPLITSVVRLTPACICDQNEPGSTPIMITPTIHAPTMPTAENSSASIGRPISTATKRGASTRSIGSTPIISMAMSCSPLFMRPMPAVMDVQARPANSSADTTGPSSRSSDSATSRPSEDSAP